VNLDICKAHIAFSRALRYGNTQFYMQIIVSDIAIFVLKRDVKLQLTN